MYSLGCILNECWTRRQPWRELNQPGGFFQVSFTAAHCTLGAMWQRCAARRYTTRNSCLQAGAPLKLRLHVVLLPDLLMCPADHCQGGHSGGATQNGCRLPRWATGDVSLDSLSKVTAWSGWLPAAHIFVVDKALPPTAAPHQQVLAPGPSLPAQLRRDHAPHRDSDAAGQWCFHVSSEAALCMTCQPAF